MEYMKTIPDKFFELAIVDPEYGIGAGKMTMGKGSRNDSGKNKAKDWDKTIPHKKYFDEIKRVSINQIIWGGNYFLDFLGATQCFLIWDKMDYNSDFASAELAWTSFNKVVKTFRRARNMGDDNKIHPTQKPVALYKWLLSNYAKQGDKILDTHMGSQSSRIAAYDMGFDYYGCELDKEYFEAGNKRFDEFKASQKLFSPQQLDSHSIMGNLFVNEQNQPLNRNLK
jgi:site-specific DNA-methyltransferase (adenine-specific)